MNHESTPLLESLKAAVAAGEVTRREVLDAIGEEASAPRGPRRHLNLQTVLTIIGGIVVLVGIATYIGQFWAEFSDGVRVLITLSPAAAIFIWVRYLSRHDASRLLTRVLLLIPAFLMPTGFHVVLRLLDVHDAELAITLNALLNLAVFLGNWVLLREPLLYYFSVASGSAAYIAGTELLVAYDSGVFRAYRFIALGIALLAFGRDADKRGIPPQVLDFAGAALALASVFYLAAEKDQLGWLLAYPLLLGLSFWGAVAAQSRVLVAAGALFTIAYTSYLSSEFFADTIGWPFAIIIIGGVIMAVGRFSWKLGATLRRR